MQIRTLGTIREKLGLRHKTLVETMTGILKEVDNMSETSRTAVVRIWYNGIGMRTAILSHDMKFRFGVIGTQLTEFLHIIVIHADDKVEIVEVVTHNRPATMRDIVATLKGEMRHTLVGALTFVKSDETSRIDNKAIRCAMLVDNAAEDSLSHRRTAYIAKAYK